MNSIYFCLLATLLPHLSFALTIEEKVGQLLLVHFNGEEANSDAELLLKEAKVSGFIYYPFSNGLTSPYQVSRLSKSLQQMNQNQSHDTPLFLAVDQEGGRVTRLKNGFTEFPSAQLIGKTANPVLEKKVAIAIGNELKQVGINMNTAPVVDVNSNPNNPIIGNRAFSHDPQVVAEFGKAAIQGYNQAGIISVMKHFPGHGDVTIDSHAGLPLITKPLESLETVEFYPFKMLKNEAPALMTGHLLIEAIDSGNPATFSRKILHNLLRDGWHYEGVVISDSLLMKGLMSGCSSYEEAALKALLAGCDLLCLGGKLLNEPTLDEISPEEVILIHRYLVNAVRTGVYPEERLNKSVERILALKEKFLLHDWKTLPELPKDAKVSTPDSEALKNEILPF